MAQRPGRPSVASDVVQLPILMVVGAALMVVAIFLPWAEARALDRGVDVTGSELPVQAVWTAVIAGCLLVCWAAQWARHSVSLALLALAGAISACAFSSSSILVASRLDGLLGTVLGESTASAEPSMGLWVLLLGGLLGGVGSSSSALRAATVRADIRTPRLSAPMPAPPIVAPPPIPGAGDGGSRSDRARGGLI